MKFQNGIFYEDGGRRFTPFGIFGNYFKAEYTGDTLALPSRHGSGCLEFQRCTLEVWEHFFTFLREEGINTIRLFPRGDSGGSAWEGLDLGGRVNRSLLELILLYAKTARQYGIRTMLGLFTQPECSVYCRKDTRIYWGQRLFDEEMRREATPSQRRFLENDDDIVDYNDFFRDPDVRACCHSFLDEILPILAENDDIFCLELYNEMGWASPNARPMNTFRWELTDDYLDWARDMADHVKRMAPDKCVCISNPGVGLLGHDPVKWAEAIRPALFSLHAYPDIIGSPAGMDYAAMSDMILKYTQTSVPAMYGEWEAGFRPRPSTRRQEELVSRDFAWLTVLSGAPGCISWRARGYGQYKPLSALLEKLEAEGRDLTRAKSARQVNIADAHEFFASLAGSGEDECRLPPHKWCPDRAATDGKHRFCVKAASEFHRRLAELERLSLETGADYDLSLTDGVPLCSLDPADFADPPENPVETPEGYHAKSLFASDGRTVITYLRNYSPVICRSEPDGPEVYTVREQRPRPVTLNLRLPGYSFELLDLETGEAVLLPAGEHGLGVTSHDFAVISRKIEMGES